MKVYLHQLWLVLICLILFACLFLPIGEFSNAEGASAVLTDFKLKFVEGDSVSAMWALGVVKIAALLLVLFVLLISGFRNFTLQKRILIYVPLLLVGYYVIYTVYALLLKEGTAYFRPMYAAALPFVAIVLDLITLRSVRKAEAAIIAGIDSFRLRD